MAARCTPTLSATHFCISRSADLAADQSASLVEQIHDLQADWSQQVATYRATKGVRETPRADSATARLLVLLPEAPVVTAGSLRRILSVSFPAANAALEELHQAGVLETRAIERGATAYICQDVLDLITQAERRLASTRFDTRTSPPNRPVPALPIHPPREDSDVD